ncbi:acyltransferase family protein [Pseudokineococcus marinus]
MAEATRPPGGAPAGGGATRRGRADIQALRALAVGLVVVYHLWPERLPGGYVGVDVFFVVSGFLITAHLVREVTRTGTVRLGRFWARRARRLLPASLLVLLVTAAAVLLVAPRTSWQPFLREVAASALYVENWSLAAGAVDYLGADDAATPVQHFWSLSTEEQFYLVWPLLVLAAAVLAARRGLPVKAVAGVVLGLVTAGSFALSLHLTTTSPEIAYFATPVRAWQFGLGGLLALVLVGRPGGADGAAPARGPGALARAVGAWAGLAAVVVAALSFTSSTPFPGAAAVLPVVGALLVLAGSEPTGRGSTHRLNALRPVQWLGDVSYAVYLWHWPLVVLVPLHLGGELTTPRALGVLAATLVLAQLSTRYVEAPLRGGWLATRPDRATAVLAAAGMAVVLVVCAAGWGVVQAQVAQARAAAADLVGDPCAGAGAIDGPPECLGTTTTAADVDTAFAAEDWSDGMACLEDGTGTELVTCEAGDPDGSTTVALVGDSHAASWYEAVTAVAEQRGWRVVTYLKAGCSVLATDRIIGVGMPAAEPPACEEWSDAVLDAVAADPEITQVFTGYRSDVYKYEGDDGVLTEQFPVDLVGDALGRLTAAGEQVHVLRAVPSTGGFETGPELVDSSVAVPACVAAADPTAPDPCSTPRAQALVPDQLVRGAEAMQDPLVDVVDLTSSFCDEERCHVVGGDLVAYVDGSHLTASWSRSLAPALDRALG